MQIKTFPLLLLITLNMAFISCEKQESGLEPAFQGRYIGTLTSLNDSKQSVQPAVADVEMAGDHLIEIHCYNEEFDTIVMLNYYQHNDEYKLCATGEEFEQMYGHMLSDQHMSQNMMMNETEWMYHMREEHSETDEHYGEFNQMQHSFEYMFLSENDLHPYLQFNGIRE